MTMLAAGRGRPAQPVPAGARWPASRATSTSPGSTASCCTSTARGSSPPPAARRGEVPDLAADRRLREGVRGGGGVPRHLRPGELLPRADGPRPRHRARSPRGPAAAGQAARPAAGRHQRPALHVRRRRRRARGAAVRAVRLDAWPTRSGSSSTAATSTSSRRRRCARCGTREVPGACDATLEIAERIGDYSALFASRNLMPQFPVPDGRDRGVLAAQGGRPRAARAVPRRGARGPRGAGRVRARRHLPDGLPGLLPGRRRPVRVRPSARASGSARAVVRPPAR